MRHRRNYRLVINYYYPRLWIMYPKLVRSVKNNIRSLTPTKLGIFCAVIWTTPSVPLWQHPSFIPVFYLSKEAIRVCTVLLLSNFKMNENIFKNMKCFVLYPGELRSSFYYTNTDVTVSFISIVTSAFISSWEMQNSIYKSNLIFFHKLHGCIIIRWMKLMRMLYTN